MNLIPCAMPQLLWPHYFCCKRFDCSINADLMQYGSYCMFSNNENFNHTVVQISALLGTHTIRKLDYKTCL